jgi:GT2 family glycosyltransferase
VVRDWGIDHAFLYSEHFTNIGYGQACNHAALFPDREVLAFFNADTVLSPGVIDQCYEALMEHEDWGVLGPRQVDSSNRITAGGVFGTQKEPTFDNRWRTMDRGQFSDVREDCINVAGSAYFIKRGVWDELASCPLFCRCPEVMELRPVGAFLPTPHYYNETYTSYHAIAHGFKVVYFGPAVMVHEWHKASPVGGYGEKTMDESRELFRSACDYHSIEHE